MFNLLLSLIRLKVPLECINLDAFGGLSSAIQKDQLRDLFGFCHLGEEQNNEDQSESIDFSADDFDEIVEKTKMIEKLIGV